MTSESIARNSDRTLNSTHPATPAMKMQKIAMKNSAR